MAHTVTARLSLHGIATQETMDRIYNIIATRSYDTLDDPKDVFEQNISGLVFAMEMRHCPDIQKDLRADLEKTGLSFILSEDADSGFAERIAIHDSRDRTTHIQHAVNGEIALTISDISKPDAIQAAIQAEKLEAEFANIALHVVDTSHEAIALLSDHPELATFPQPN